MFLLVRRLPRFRLPRRSRPDAPREGGELSPPGRPGFASIPDRLQDAWYAVEDAALAAGRLTVDAGRDLWERWLDLSIYTRRLLARGWARCWRSCCCGCSRSRRFPAGRLAGTPAHRPTTRSTWCPTTRSPTSTSTSTPAPSSTRRRPRSPRACRRSPSRRSVGCLRGFLVRTARARLRARRRALVRWRGRARDPAGRRPPARRWSCWRWRTRMARQSSPTRSQPGRRASGVPRRPGPGRQPRGGDRARRRVSRDRDRERREGRDRRRQRGGRRLAGGRSAARARRWPPSPKTASPTSTSPRTASRGSSPAGCDRWPRSAW